MSLTVNELRIGNRVFSPVNQCEGTVVAIETGGRPIIDIGVSEPYTVSFSGTDCLSGIPLSVELLEACGFKLGAEGQWFIFPNTEIGIFYDLQQVCIGQLLLEELVLSSFHQLQNLMFSLTGRELVYNPSK